MSRGVDSIYELQARKVNTTETNWIAEIGEVPPAAPTVPPTPKAEGRHLKEPEDLGTSPAKTPSPRNNRHHKNKIEDPPT